MMFDVWVEIVGCQSDILLWVVRAWRCCAKVGAVFLLVTLVRVGFVSIRFSQLLLSSKLTAPLYSVLVEL